MAVLSATPGDRGETDGLGGTGGCKSPELFWPPQELNAKAATEMSATAVKTTDVR